MSKILKTFFVRLACQHEYDGGTREIISIMPKETKVFWRCKKCGKKTSNNPFNHA